MDHRLTWPFVEVELKKQYSLEDVARLMDWETTNKRRDTLINKKIAKTITQKEWEELQHLQSLAGIVRDAAMPLGALPTVFVQDRLGPQTESVRGSKS